MSVLRHELLLKLLTVLLLCMIAGASVVERASKPAQAPGFLPVICSDSHDFTSEQTAKRNVDSNCNSYANAPAIAPGWASVQNLYIVGGVLQTKIENLCDSPYHVNIDGCKLEFNSIAYGCSENGRFYNGSSSFGCINYVMQVFNESSLFPRADDDRLLCEFAQEGNFTAPNSTLISEIARGCDVFDEEFLPVSQSYKWWHTQLDGSVIEFKVSNLNAIQPMIGDKVTCQSDFSLLAQICSGPSGYLYHGRLRQDGAEWDIIVFPPGHNPFAVGDPTPIEPRQALESSCPDFDVLGPIALKRSQTSAPTCLEYLNSVDKEVARSRKDNSCSTLEGKTLDAGRSKNILWAVGGGDLLIKLTNVNTAGSTTVSSSSCSAAFDEIIASCPAGVNRFGHGVVTRGDVRYELEMLGNNGGVGTAS